MLGRIPLSIHSPKSTAKPRERPKAKDEPNAKAEPNPKPKAQAKPRQEIPVPRTERGEKHGILRDLYRITFLRRSTLYILY